MKKILLNGLFCIALASVAMPGMAQGEKTDVSTSIADTWVRKDAANNNYGSKTTMELKTKDNTDFVGLISFLFPAEASSDKYEIKSATLRLVTERPKGSRTFCIYKYVDFAENTNYKTEKDKLATARTEANLVGTYTAKGQGGKAFPYDAVSDDYKTVEAWTNNIDLTDFVKSLDTNSFALMIEHTNSADQLMFYTKETDDVTNAKDATLVFKKEDLIPQLTIVYAPKDATGIESLKTNVSATSDNKVYNLQGMRMNSNNLPAGIYIKNGKKFVVK